jgi:sugar/nucleoside kinase (ribokinase family)
LSAQTFDVVVIGGIYREVLEGNSDAPKSRLLGSGLTAAIISSRFEAKTSLVSFVGEQDWDTLALILGASGVDGSNVRMMRGRSGTFVFPASTEATDTPWPMYRPAEDIPDSLPALPSAAVYLAFGFPDFDPVLTGTLDALPSGATLLWDRQGWLSRTRDCDGVARSPAQRKIYLANRSEAEEEFALPIDQLPERLPPPGFQAAVIKDGPRGTSIMNGIGRTQRMTLEPSFPVETGSTIGSGDVFAGALAASLARGDAMRSSVLLGNAAASCYLHLDCDPLGDRIRDCAIGLVSERTH